MSEDQLAALPALTASAQGRLIQGVLVRSGAPSGQNPAPAFPLSELAPYEAAGYSWNPAGQGLVGSAFPFSINQLDGNATARALRWACLNQERVSCPMGPINH